MAAERLSMRCVKEVLRQKWVLKKSNREVARSLGISSGFVSGVVTRAAAIGLNAWAEIDGLTGGDLGAMRSSGPGGRPYRRSKPLRFQASRISASTGCTGTSRGFSVFVVLSILSRGSHDPTTESRPSGFGVES